MPASRRTMVRLAGACVLALGGAAGLAVSGAGAAGAATCIPGAACTATGTADLSGGSLSLTAPGTLTWATALTGAPQQVPDAVGADQSLTVDDATGSGAGWSLTVGASTFTTGGATPITLADSGTFSVNGNPLSETANTAPDAVCTVTGTCTPPTGNLVAGAYPVPVTTGAAAATLYTAAAGSGFGSVLLGSAAPIGWWISLPSTTLAGTYTSTVSLGIVSGP